MENIRVFTKAVVTSMGLFLSSIVLLAFIVQKSGNTGADLLIFSGVYWEYVVRPLFVNPVALAAFVLVVFTYFLANKEAARLDFIRKIEHTQLPAQKTAGANSYRAQPVTSETISQRILTMTQDERLSDLGLEQLSNFNRIASSLSQEEIQAAELEAQLAEMEALLEHAA